MQSKRTTLQLCNAMQSDYTESDYKAISTKYIQRNSIPLYAFLIIKIITIMNDGWTLCDLYKSQATSVAGRHVINYSGIGNPDFKDCISYKLGSLLCHFVWSFLCNLSQLVHLINKLHKSLQDNKYQHFQYTKLQ